MTDIVILERPLTREESVEQAWRAWTGDGPLPPQLAIACLEEVLLSRSPRGAYFILLSPREGVGEKSRRRLIENIIVAADPWWAYCSMLSLTFRGDEKTAVKRLRAVVENSGDRRCIYFLHRYVDGLPHSRS